MPREAGLIGAVIRRVAVGRPARSTARSWWRFGLEESSNALVGPIVKEDVEGTQAETPAVGRHFIF